MSLARKILLPLALLAIVGYAVTVVAGNPIHLLIFLGIALAGVTAVLARNDAAYQAAREANDDDEVDS